jgi:quercetin dioxygenase-like cupin family protein
MSENVHVASANAETSTFLGTQNRILLKADQTDRSAGVVDILVQPGAGVPLHTNTREALIWYGIDGSMTLQTEDGPVDLAPGDAIFLPKGFTHAFANASDRPARALLVCLPGGFEGFLQDLSGRLPVEAPTGPPPQEAIEILTTTAERYGQVIHLERSAS